MIPYLGRGWNQYPSALYINEIGISDFGNSRSSALLELIAMYLVNPIYLKRASGKKGFPMEDSKS